MALKRVLQISFIYPTIILRSGPNLGGLAPCVFDNLSNRNTGTRYKGKDGAQMLKRYTLPPMRELWLREETKFERWHEVELAVLFARAQKGEISMEAYTAIRAHARIDVGRIEALEAVLVHDMLAFIGCIQESLDAAGVGQYRGEYHKYLTSYNVEDPALILILRQAAELILTELVALQRALENKAREHQWTLMVARTHGQYAEPTTFGHLLEVYACAVGRSIRRLRTVRDTELTEGNISGAVGNYADVDPAIEEPALAVLGLHPAEAETQILQRDRHAMVLSVLAVAASTIEQICRTFWEMMRSDVGELREPRKSKQRGSSAMPWKKNPVFTEQLMGLPRLVRAYAEVACENVATPEWRDISQSSVERHILPDATALVHYMASKLASLVNRLEVFPDRMGKNLEATRGVWAGNRVRNALLEAGVDPNVAYEHVQRCSFQAVDQGLPLYQALEQGQFAVEPLDAEGRTAADIIGKERLASFFDARTYIERGIKHIFGDDQPPNPAASIPAQPS
ncbi:MAG: adenylosuccinate lyase [Patescibacteria group bacterium]|nr:adenylosuccinate lyase [Patescibacteria group bacterium]